MINSDEKSYKSFYITLKSPLFSPFNTMNLYLHFTTEKSVNSIDGYYFVNSFEHYKNNLDEFNDNYKTSQLIFLKKQLFEVSSIRKIATA